MKLVWISDPHTNFISPFAARISKPKYQLAAKQFIKLFGIKL